MENVTSVTCRMAWSVYEVALYTGLSPGFIRKQIRDGKLHAKKVGRRILVLDSDLYKYLQQEADEP
jgi:excisionase family DNA binding protein